MNRADLSSSVYRAISYLSYTPLLGAAAAISLLRVLLYAMLLGVAQFGLLSQLLLVSGLFGLFGNMGTQLVAHRDVPRMLQRGQSREAVSVLVQTTYVTILVAAACLPLGWLGLRLFQLTPFEYALAVVHGLSAQIFLTFLIESKSRLAMIRYARDMFVRAILVAVGGASVAYLGWGGPGVIASEAAFTFVILPFLAVSILANSGVKWSDVGPIATRAWRNLPWLASFILLAGSLVAYASLNIDRWFAASALDHFEFGQYSFAWIPLLVAQSLQFLLNAGIFPLLARHDRGAPALRLTAHISLSVLGSSAVAGFLAWLLVKFAIPAYLPKYAAALPLLGPLIAAAAFRISDFWSSFLIVAKCEWVLLKVQTAVLVLVLLGWTLDLTIMHQAMSAEALVWLAFAAAVTAHAASAGAAIIVARRYVAGCPSDRG